MQTVTAFVKALKDWRFGGFFLAATLAVLFAMQLSTYALPADFGDFLRGDTAGYAEDCYAAEGLKQHPLCVAENMAWFAVYLVAGLLLSAAVSPALLFAAKEKLEKNAFDVEAALANARARFLVVLVGTLLLYAALALVVMAGFAVYVVLALGVGALGPTAALYLGGLVESLLSLAAVALVLLALPVVALVPGKLALGKEGAVECLHHAAREAYRKWEELFGVLAAGVLVALGVFAVQAIVLSIPLALFGSGVAVYLNLLNVVVVGYLLAPLVSLAYAQAFLVSRRG